MNHTLKYGFEFAEGWKVVADNFELRIEGDEIGHESARGTIGRMSSPAFWAAPELHQAVLARLPGYRLSKFQDCLPEKLALEVIENYLLDVAGDGVVVGGVVSAPGYRSGSGVSPDAIAIAKPQLPLSLGSRTLKPGSAARGAQQPDDAVRANET